MSSSRRPFALVLALVTLAACGDKSVTGGGTSNELSASDAVSLILAVAPQLQRSVSSINGGSGSMSNTATCPHGGSVHASLDTGSGSANVMMIVHADCRVDGPDGRIWTVNGDPSLRLTIGSVSVPTSLDGNLVISMKIVGTLQVAGGSMSGTCPIDTNFDIRVNTAASMTSTGRYSGKVCGQLVDETLTATAP